jgi:hypothetical protein
MFMNVLIGFALLAGAVVSPSPSSSSSRVDFSGTWVPDLNAHQRTREPKTPEAANLPATSLQGGGILFLPPLRISDDGSTLTFDSLSEDGRVISTLRLSTGGKDETTLVAGGARTRTSRSTREGRSLKTEWRQTGADASATSTGTETWTLSSDNGTLTHTTTSEDTSWRNQTKTTYKRK